jgi:hypothetical protein
VSGDKTAPRWAKELGAEAGRGGCPFFTTLNMLKHKNAETRPRVPSDARALPPLALTALLYQRIKMRLTACILYTVYIIYRPRDIKQ